jgi:hypothetical protein
VLETHLRLKSELPSSWPIKTYPLVIDCTMSLGVFFRDAAAFHSSSESSGAVGCYGSGDGGGSLNKQKINGRKIRRKKPHQRRIRVSSLPVSLLPFVVVVITNIVRDGGEVIVR